MMAAVADGGS